jgi:hypothetical protein
MNEHKLKHAFHDQIETLIVRLRGTADEVANAPPPHTADPVLFGDHRTHEQRVNDFELHRKATLRVIGSARSALELLDRAPIVVGARKA